MIKVNNKRTIRQVAYRVFKADKMRNIFAVTAVVLTTILFSGLFMIASSLLSSMEESTMRQVGGNAHAGFKYLTEEQYERLKVHPDIKEISYSVVLATAENAELVKRPTEIRYANDALEAKMMFSMPTEGRMPEAADEIATDTLVLEKLGVPARLGEKVVLEYSVCGQTHRDTFVLVGFWEGDVIMRASQAWLSKSYVEEVLSQHDLSKADAYIGSINADVNFANSWNIESKVLKVILESGYETEEIDYGINWAYAGGSTTVDAGTIGGVILIVLMIVFCGYLMISNVFLISVVKDVRFYGLLKMVGTTGSQIKTIIRRQALLISMIAIPIGLLMGIVVGAGLTPYVLGILNTNVIKVTLQPWVFLFATGFSLLTVFISIGKASKLAEKVSPIEALRAVDISDNRRKEKRHGGKIRLWKMAAENVGRNRKKVILVVVSLSLSLIILNTAYTMANSFDMEKYLSRMISHDFVVGDVSWFNIYSHYINQDTLNDDFMKELSIQNGIESLGKIYFSEKGCALDSHWDNMAERASNELGVSGDWLTYMEEEIQSGGAMYHIYGIDDAVWDELTVWKGEIDLDKLYSGDYVVVSPYDEEGRLSAYEVGDTVEVFGMDGESRSCEVLAVASMPYNVSIQHTHPVEINIFLPSEIFLKTVEQKAPMIVSLDVEDLYIPEMEEFLSNYCNVKNPNMQYASRAIYEAEYENTQRTYKVVGIVISVLLALIGVANFANTSITSVMARRRELAMLESIGMTVKQQRGMLIFEGVIYMLLAAAFTWTIGILFGMCGLSLMLGGSEYFTVKFTVVPSMVCLPVFLILSVLIPMLCQKYVNSESVVERLRNAE
ncbi:MAG: ABC transporter permease [Lachnospiraceae bacterium]|nr:ABC transporter permease [Lachnospiraceae bacterium]